METIKKNGIEFKQIKNYPNYYISKCGKVFSNISNKVLKTKLDRGYERLNLYNHLGVKMFSVHRLIGETFIPNPKNKPTINHKNGIRNDNNIDNLEWNTYSENHVHSYRELGRKSSKPWLGKFGKLHCNSTEVLQYNKQGKFIKHWHSLADVERNLNIKYRNVVESLSGRNKTAGGFIWRYVKS